MSVNVSWKSLIIPLAMNAQYLKTINYDVALVCYLCALESMCEGFFGPHNNFMISTGVSEWCGE